MRIFGHFHIELVNQESDKNAFSYISIVKVENCFN